jgi:hypothetical protein
VRTKAEQGRARGEFVSRELTQRGGGGGFSWVRTKAEQGRAREEFDKE